MTVLPRPTHRRVCLVLLSMTGHGLGESGNDDLHVTAELKTVNNRYLKVSVRSNENTLSIEPKIEAMLKQQIRRGTVQVNLRIERQADPDKYKLNMAVLDSYVNQLSASKLNSQTPDVAALLMLPGVVQESVANPQDDEDWNTISAALNNAIENLQTMRSSEGESMARDMTENCQAIVTELDQIEKRAPQVIDAYQTRLSDRLTQLLEKHDLEFDPSAIIREVGVFAERCDISEETVRIRSHLEQFDVILNAKESNGRKLDFLTQELFREVNTIGSKANDAEIARHVVEIKTVVERIREMVQNAE